MTDVVLQQRDSDVLQALCEDRAECGRGLTWADLEHAGRTRWVHHILRRLAKAGHAIASTGSTKETMRWQLMDPQTSAGAPDERRPASVMGSGPAPAGTIGQASGASAEGTLFALPAEPHWREAA